MDDTDDTAAAGEPQSVEGGFATLIWDLLFFAGLGVIAIGLGWIYAPLGLIAVGLALCLLGWWGARVSTASPATATPEPERLDDAD